MQDAKGRELHRGDKILIPARVVDISDAGEVLIQTEGSHPAHAAGSLSAHRGFVGPQVIRNNKGDDTTFEVLEDNGHRIIR